MFPNCEDGSYTMGTRKQAEEKLVAFKEMLKNWSAQALEMEEYQPD